MSVKFLKLWKAYNIGEVATFKDDEERMLVAKGIAERVTLQPDNAASTPRRS
jgi:hypothetical protein